MTKGRVLVVDDSVVVRKVVTDILGAEPDLEVVGTAANGKICLQKVGQVNPEIITLDFEMPEMNGIETLKELREKFPKVKVIMFSALTEQGAALTLEALSLGAADYVTKPTQVGSAEEARAFVKSQLVTKIRSLLSSTAADAKSSLRAASIKIPKERARTSDKVDIVCVGVSTGGPKALVEVIPKLPKDLGVPIVVVQHMPPMFTKILAERLSLPGCLPVKEAVDCMPLEANTVYIAPGDYHMEVKKMTDGIFIKLNQNPHENSCRPAVDPLFRSVANIYGANVLGVIMTGMGRDGCLGCEALREVGGEVIIQDEKSSVVWGMPGAIAEADLANGIYPLNEIAGQIIARVRKGASLKTNS
jgi:two-component system chemotaxis response regulator CheB